MKLISEAMLPEESLKLYFFPRMNDNIASIVPQGGRQWTLTMPLAEWLLVNQKLDAPIIAIPLATRLDAPLSLFLTSIACHSKHQAFVSDQLSLSHKSTHQLQRKVNSLSLNSCDSRQAMPDIIKCPSDGLPQSEEAGSYDEERKGRGHWSMAHSATLLDSACYVKGAPSPSLLAGISFCNPLS